MFLSVESDGMIFRLQFGAHVYKVGHSYMMDDVTNCFELLSYVHALQEHFLSFNDLAAGCCTENEDFLLMLGYKIFWFSSYGRHLSIVAYPGFGHFKVIGT